MPGFTRVDFPLFRKITTPVQSAAAVSVSVRASTVVARWRCAARTFFLEAEAEAFLVLAALNARKAFFDVARVTSLRVRVF